MFTPVDIDSFMTVTVQVVPVISPRSLTALGVVIGEVDQSYIYDGLAKEPTVEINDSFTVLTDSDYTITYGNNIDVGSAELIVTGQGNYAATVVMNFTIKAPTPEPTPEPTPTPVPIFSS